MQTESLEIAEKRKQSHLDLTNDSQNKLTDQRFYYEPMLSAHPQNDLAEIQFGNKVMKAPLWISSMTGGTAAAGPINKMLAKAAKRYGLGMGLGSCRSILEDDTYFEDFNLRPLLGDEQPLFANLGIAQIEQLIESNKLHLVNELIEKLDADGLFLHINPFQELLQPEGDIIKEVPLVTLKKLLEGIKYPVIVKEVGQGFGPESLKELLSLPIFAVDFAANGGTNFAKLELLRNKSIKEVYGNLVPIGHTAEEMVEFVNQISETLGEKRLCNQLIISGGVKDFLDGYYLTNKVNIPAIYGQASAFLNKANESEEALDEYIKQQIEGLKIAQAYLKVK